jgi:uncharacterized membrane protein YphA (DoxX/SURF4 family)
MKKPVVIEIITVLYIILFLYTGIAKLMDYRIFKEQLEMSPVLSPIAKPVSLLLPWAEFIVVLLLVIPRWRLKGLYTSLILMTLFLGYIIAILSFSDQLPCSCGGIIQAMSWKQHVMFNSLFIGLAIWAIVLEKKLNLEKSKSFNLIMNSEWAIRSK